MSKENVLEPHARYIGTTAELFINADASWSIGTNTKSLVKVKFGDIATINDSTFGFSAVSVESDGQGGYRLFVRSDAGGADANGETIVEVAVDAAGNVNPASVAVLTQGQMYTVENQYKVDLNNSGSFGSEPLLVEGGAVNLYYSADGVYQIGNDPAALQSLNVGGAPLTDSLLASVGFEIVEIIPNDTGYDVYAKDANGVIFDAKFNPTGGFGGGDVLSPTQLAQVEETKGIDINGDNSVPAAPGWTSSLKSAALKTAVEAALGDGKINHTEAVTIVKGVVDAHKSANTPISADEVADLQALASRGKALFAGASDTAAEYLGYVFGKMVESSDANRFYTGGEAKPSELGSLAAGSPADRLEKLMGKWLLGNDMPTPSIGGDTATGKAQSFTGTYAKSSGTLFVDGVALADVQQGTAGDCYMVAVAGGIAGTKASAITAMIVENAAVDGSRSWGVRFYDAKGAANWVTVNDMLPVQEAGSTTLPFGGAPGKDLNGEIWFALVEKAYAQANSLGILPRAEANGQNTYSGVEGGNGEPLANFLGGKVVSYSLTPGSSFGENPYITANVVDRADAAAVAALENTLKAAFNAGNQIWIGVTTSVKDSSGNLLLVGSHAHFALDAAPTDPSNNSLLVYNPWGLAAAGSAGAEHVSPAAYDLVQLIGLTDAGLDFMIFQPLGG